MKNLFLTFFTFTVLNTVAQINFNYSDFNGHWITDDSIYELVILYNEEDEFQFLNFNLESGTTLDEKVLNYKDGIIKTQLINKENDWDIHCSYSIISKDSLSVKITGSYDGTIIFKRLY